jgi:outer membrane protein N
MERQMATHFARGILTQGHLASTRLSSACHNDARKLPEHRRSRFLASRALLAELLFMLYGTTGNEGTNNGRDIRHENGDGFGISTTYDLGMGFSAGAAYTTSDRTNAQINNTTAGGDKADAWTAGLKYDANNIYLATMYSETRNMTPYGKFDDAVANKTQNVEVTAQYQFDFGLRPVISYLQSKGKDLGNGWGDQDLVKYAEVGMVYYFNKNMSTYIDYKINLLDEDKAFYAANGIGTDDIVATGLVYQF